MVTNRTIMSLHIFRCYDFQFFSPLDIQLVYKDQIAHLGTAVPETSSKIVPTSGSHPTVEVSLINFVCYRSIPRFHQIRNQSPANKQKNR